MKVYGIMAIIAIVSFLAGKYVFPPKADVKEVVKIVEVEKKQEKKNKVTKIVEIKKPDGTVETDTTEVENTQTVTDTSIKSESTKVTKSANKITLGLLAIKQADDFSKATQFGATVAVPLIGNLKVQALGTTDKRVGLGLALDF